MLNRVHSLRSTATLRAGLAAALFLYVFFVRTRGITESFCLLGDQILYWRMALGPWQDLPAGGGPTSAGGTTLGPVFCWFIWLVGHTIGPLLAYLPHAGGIGVSLAQSAADSLLFLAVWSRFRSLVLALGVVLLAATSPFDMSLTATIWNPPLTVALAKLSMAAALMARPGGPLALEGLAIATAWLAVQAHSAAIFFAAPVIASFTVLQLAARQWRQAAWRAAAAAAIVVVLQVPYLLDKVRHPDAARNPGEVVASVSQTLAHPGSLRAAESTRAVAGALDVILFRPATAFWPVLVFCAAGLAVGVRFRRDLGVVAVTAAPMACAAAGFALWQKGYDTYWFLVLAPSASLLLGLALTSWRPLATPAAVVSLVMIAAGQPGRSAESLTLHRLPEYGILLRGSRAIRRHLPEVRAVKVSFPLPASTEPDYLYQLLGGRVSPEAAYVATIDRRGHATFGPAEPAPPPSGE